MEFGLQWRVYKARRWCFVESHKHLQILVRKGTPVGWSRTNAGGGAPPAEGQPHSATYLQEGWARARATRSKLRKQLSKTILRS